MKRKSGDKLLFSGRGVVPSLIKLFTGSHISHIGMIYEKGEELFVLESTTINGNGHIELVQYGESVETYKGKVYHLPLKEELTSIQKAALDIFVEMHLGKLYRNHFVDMVKRGLDVAVGKQNDKVPLCAELCAEFDIMINLFWENVPAIKYTPADYANKNEYIGHRMQIKDVYQYPYRRFK